jgi:hypothetical protein
MLLAGKYLEERGEEFDLGERLYPALGEEMP